ncbi:MAG: HAD-IIB family hydrolase [Phycisphaerae bacterium]
MYKLIALDIDGTTVDPTGRVSPATAQAVSAAAAAGFEIVLATGRNWTESRAIALALGHAGLGVFVGGAEIVDCRADRVLHRVHMDPGLARAVCRQVEAAGHTAMALQDAEVAGHDYLLSEGRGLGAEMESWLAFATARIARTPDLGTFAHPHTMRVGVVAKPEFVAEQVTLLERHFGDAVVHHVIHVPAYGVDVLEVFDPNVNKWQGLQWILSQRGYKPEEVVAVGDDVNDLPMIQAAGLGVAMGNGKPEVQKVAKLVIGRNDADGLANFLRQLVAEHGPD